MSNSGGEGLLSPSSLCICPWLAISLTVFVYPFSMNGHSRSDASTPSFALFWIGLMYFNVNI